ncbi:kinetochore protein NUF2 homolog [Coffea arabica]|uniref:Kinetochore protein NUF2 homolog n=1 Tax=Coffea arabica TaxID=13443 RepID=A0A6P6VTK8_COFAR
MSKFQYPTLSRSDVVAVLSEYEIAKISDADLRRPNFNFLTSLYSAVLLYIDILPEEPDQFDFETLERIDNPDHHRDSFRVLNLLDKIRELLASIDCPLNFTLCDLLKPDPGRTDFFLGAMLNYIVHRNAKLDLLRPIVDELTLLEERKQELESRMSQLNEEIFQFNQLRESEMPLVQEIDAKVKELQQTIQSLNNHQVSLKANRIKTKEKVKEMEAKVENADFALEQCKLENKSLLAEIVQSPDKLQRGLEEKKSLKVEAKNAERAAMHSFHAKEAVSEIYAKAGMKLSKQLARMKVLQDQVNSAKSIEKDVKLLKVKLSDQGVLDKSLDAKLVDLQAKVDQLDKVKWQLEQERGQTFEQATKELKNVKMEVEANRSALQTRQKQVEAVVMEADSIGVSINSVKEAGAAKMHEMGLVSEAIMKQFYEYSDSIRDSLPGIEIEVDMVNIQAGN